MIMHICSPPVYQFEGWTFEDNGYTMPWPLKKDWEPRARAGRKFWAVFRRWYALPKRTREKYRVGGGCYSINTTEGRQ